MAYVFVRNKEVSELRNRLCEANVLQEDEKEVTLLRDEAGLPLRDCPQTQEAIANQCIAIKKRSYFVCRRRDGPSEILREVYDVIVQSVKLILTKKNLWRDELVNETPKTWLRFQSTALVGSRCFLDPTWARGAPEVWDAVCKALGVTRLVRRCKRQPGGIRSPKAVLLHGDSSWVTFIEMGVRISWDLSTSLLSLVDISEWNRVGRMRCRGQTIVNLYAGIGEYTLNFILHGRAEMVHACEWNPTVVLALRYNIMQNFIMNDKCTIHLGDNQEVGYLIMAMNEMFKNEVCPENVADRVYVGQIPASENGILTACKALNNRNGGVIHLHGIVTSYRKKLEMISPLVASTPDQIPPKPVRVFPYEPPCQQCHTALINFPQSLMQEIKDSFSYPPCYTETFCLEGKGVDPYGISTCYIKWEKNERFMQSLHFAHLACCQLSSLHNNAWRVELRSIHFVKEFTADVEHLVYDYKCYPAENSGTLLDYMFRETQRTPALPETRSLI